MSQFTAGLADMYRRCNPDFQFDESMKPQRVMTEVPNNVTYNDGFDNENGDYIVRIDDVITSPEAEVFIITDLLGAGTFGQVVRATNQQTGEELAIKILKNKKNYLNQGAVEVKILHELNSKDPRNEMGIVKMKDYFVFKGHLCIVFEMLFCSLYETLYRNEFKGLSLNLS